MTAVYIQNNLRCVCGEYDNEFFMHGTLYIMICGTVVHPMIQKSFFFPKSFVSDSVILFTVFIIFRFHHKNINKKKPTTATRYGFLRMFNRREKCELIF